MILTPALAPTCSSHVGTQELYPPSQTSAPHAPTSRLGPQWAVPMSPAGPIFLSHPSPLAKLLTYKIKGTPVPLTLRQVLAWPPLLSPQLCCYEDGGGALYQLCMDRSVWSSLALLPWFLFPEPPVPIVI